MARILACGAFLKNAACLLDTEAPLKPLWSAPHGDLSDPAACEALEQSVRALLEQVGGRIDAVAHDLHPDFFSTHLALRLAHEHGVSAIAVQHHHAHIAAVLAEHGTRHDKESDTERDMARPVLGIALDGVGLGTDGVAWGGEVLLVDGAHFERVGHLSPLALPGGDVAAREPWRMAAAALHACGLAEQIVPRFAPTVGEQAARTIHTMLQRGLNCPQTTAAGRWFDAMAGLLGLSVRQEFEAQAAILRFEGIGLQPGMGLEVARNTLQRRHGQRGNAAHNAVNPKTDGSTADKWVDVHVRRIAVNGAAKNRTRQLDRVAVAGQAALGQ